MVLNQLDSELYFETVCAVFKKEVLDDTSSWVKYYKEDWQSIAEKELSNIKYLPRHEYFLTPFPSSQVQDFKYPYHHFKTLDDWIEEQAIDADYTERAFGIAKQMLLLIKLLHQHQMIHGAVNTSHFLVSERDKVFLSEWGFLTRTVQPELTQKELYYSKGIINYIAPEQTGRIDSKTGFYTDLYSLGACFYKLFTGHTIFEETDPISIIYKHLTFDPLPADQLNSYMGKAAANVIRKLLSKEPQKRFISAEATQSALEQAYERFKNKDLFNGLEQIDAANLNRFSLIQHFPTLIENKIYYFKSQYLQAVESNECFLFFIQGLTGSGKQFAVTHFCELISDRKTLVLNTFFYKDEPIPYEPFKLILDQVTRYYLSQEEEELINFRNICSENLGSSINILLDICPDLKHIIPYAKQNKEEGLIELQNQLIYAFASLLKIILSSGKKLVLCLKDIHYATAGVLKIIDGILNEFPSTRINLIFSYENRSLKPNQLSYILKWQNQQQPGFTKGKIELVPLTNFQTSKLFAAAGLIEDDLETLTDILFPKTNWLVLLMDRACETLVANDALYYDSEKSKWRLKYEKAIISNINFVNPASYFEGLIAKLSNEELILLSYATAFGKSFSFDIIKTAIKNERLAINLLDQLIHKAILKESGRIGFYDFCEPDLSNFILQNINGKALTEIYFAIIEAYTRMPDLEISDEDFFNLLDKLLNIPPNQAKSFVSILWMGIEKTNKLALFDINYQCYTHLIRMVEDDDWITNKEALIDLYIEYIKSASLVMKFDVCEQSYTFLRRLPLTKLQLGNLGYSYANALFIKQDFRKSILVLAEILLELGIPLNTNPSLFKIILSMLSLRSKMRGKDMAYIEKLPLASDDLSFVKIKLLQNAMGAAYFYAPKMVPELTLKQLSLSLKSGASDLFGVCLTCYAFILSIYTNSKEAEKIYSIARTMNDRFGDPVAKATSEFLYSTFIGINHLPWRECSEKLYNNYIFSRQIGQVNIAFFSLITHFTNQFYSESNIERLAESIEELLPIIQSNKQENAFSFLNILLSCTKDLLSDHIPAIKLATHFPTIETVKKLANDQQEFTTLNHIYILEEMLDFFNDDYAVVKTRVKKMQEMKSQLGMVNSFIMHHFFIGLRLLKKEGALKFWELSFIRKTMRLLAKTTKQQKENGYAKYQLLKGFYILRKNKTVQALFHLQSAYDFAVLNDQYMTAAIASEGIATIYRRGGMIESEKNYLRNAHTQYNFWAAKSLTRKLEEANSFLQTGNEATESQKENSGPSASVQNFIAESNALNAEAGLQNHLENLITILIENAAAENAFFIIVDHNNQFIIYASKRGNGPIQTEQVPANKAALPLTVIQYVFRTKKGLQLNNASKDAVFKTDTYISENQVCSILCTPVLKNNQIRALILLENNQITQAFTHEKSELVQVLASQIAISFENMALFNSTEEKTILSGQNLANKKSIELELNMIPFEIAKELPEKESQDTKLHKNVTVLFVEFINFKSIAEKHSFQELIVELDYCFKSFDQIINQYGLQKIKTLNGAYLAVCGLPIQTERHAERVVEAALDIQKFIQENKRIKKAAAKIYFDTRTGISSGSVAVIADTKKHSLDIWGSAVNQASVLMENCEANKINISADTFELIKEWFDCELREKIKSTGNDSIAMYYVNDQQIFYKIRQRVFLRMQDLDSGLYYHSIWHTTDVLNQAERIALAEGIHNERQLLLLKIAALYHDIGFLNTYINHEEESCHIFLSDAESQAYELTINEKDLICNMIMATKVPQDPQSKLEQILCDADLDYLGRDDFWLVGKKLFSEMFAYEFLETENEWNEMQIKFLKTHRYCTETSLRLRNEKKETYLQILIEKRNKDFY
ncbi:MAG: GAF domain-containing protein [Chitinophagaceae bacterium]|nr:GAF domain-containing protein [Chitinophagaceae bacterium]